MTKKAKKDKKDKKERKQEKEEPEEVEEVAEEVVEEVPEEQPEDSDLADMPEEEYNNLKFQKFGQREINNVEQIKTRLHEVKQNFYNRLESKKLIKKQGKIPFLEHMTITHEKPCELEAGAASLQINDDIKREVLFYNLARDNVMKGMQIMV